LKEAEKIKLSVVEFSNATTNPKAMVIKLENTLLAFMAVA
jgi:hypothetical protein